LSAVLVLQGALFYGFSHGEITPPARPLAEFPARIGEWRMIQQGELEQEVKDVLRADDYLTRRYAAPDGEAASLFVAYFQSQRPGQTPHSPKNWLPGSGWAWTVSDTISIGVEGRAQIVEINRYIVSKGDEKAVVLYWYQSRDRVVASEYRAAAFTAWDALRYNRTDTRWCAW
jgi:EpsI family protein